MSAILLCLDTAGSRCGVAIYDMTRGAMLARAEPDIGRGHAELLMGLIGENLGRVGLGYADIGKIAVVTGPGSFTGIRVAVAAAKGLALALEVPAVGVGALEALAEPHWQAGSVLAVTDAKRGEVYVAAFAPGGAVRMPPTAIAVADIADRLSPVGGPFIAVGSGAEIARSALPDRVTAVHLGAVDLAAVARIGSGRTPTAALTPLYLRGADAKPSAPSGIVHSPGTTLP